MSHIRITLPAVGRCHVVHSESGGAVETDGAPEFGGGGTSFSATDLLAAALGACIATNVDKVVVRNGLPIEALSVEVEKTLADNPKRIDRLTVLVIVKGQVDEKLRTMLERAAESCVVHRSLHNSIEVAIEIVVRPIT